jgi:glycerophosphoryl diester phosphodiesterase
MDSKIWIIAHRGASADAPENTLPAFQLAWQMGVDGIEGDFHLTADAQVVCIHDATTKRLADIHLSVERSNYQQLRSANVAHAFNPKGPPVHIPLLSEVIATVPSGKQIFIELKSGPKIVHPLIEVLECSKLHPEQVILFSFNTTVLRTLQSLGCPYRTGLIIDFKIANNGRLTPTLDNSLCLAKQLGCAGIHIGAHPKLPTNIGEQARAHGLQLHTWTVDTHQLCQTMQALGVQSITTNKPETIQASLGSS